MSSSSASPFEVSGRTNTARTGTSPCGVGTESGPARLTVSCAPFAVRYALGIRSAIWRTFAVELPFGCQADQAGSAGCSPSLASTMNEPTPAPTTTARKT